MKSRLLGRTGMTVSVLGLGAGPLGDPALDDIEAERLVLEAFDLGINVIDTAPSYGLSEARIGRVLRSLSPAQRESKVVITKGGYGVPGVLDWTPEVIERGIDQALARLGIDRIDVFLLHSCPLERLARGDLVAPLERAREQGKVRAIGYSGDGAALAWSVAEGHRFDVVECSVNLVDQQALSDALPRAAARGLGVLGKRTVAGAPWSDPSSAYVDRWRVAFLEQIRGSGAGRAPAIDGLAWDELALRFAAHVPGLSTSLLGTRRIEHLRRAAEVVARGPLPEAATAEIRRRFTIHGAEWPGIV